MFAVILQAIIDFMISAKMAINESNVYSLKACYQQHISILYAYTLISFVKYRAFHNTKEMYIQCNN